MIFILDVYMFFRLLSRFVYNNCIPRNANFFDRLLICLYICFSSVRCLDSCTTVVFQGTRVFWSIVVNFNPWKRKMIFILYVYILCIYLLCIFVAFLGTRVFLIDCCKFWFLEEKDDFYIRCIYLLLHSLEREFFDLSL